MLAVVLLSGLAGEGAQLHLVDGQPLALDAADDLADEAAADAVGLDQDQGGFGSHGRAGYAPSPTAALLQ